MKTPITYYGGKQQMADLIISRMPKHNIYCEPYFGGGAVFFAKGPSYLEAINDINDRLIIFYRQLKNNFFELSDLIHDTLHCESEYKRAKAIYNNWRSASDVEVAWSVWMMTNCSFSGTPEGGWKWCNGSAGSHSGIVLQHERDRFTKKLWERLQNVQISCRDALTVIEQRDTEGTFFYLDPPYPGADQKHYRGFTIDHLAELLKVLEGIKGKFMLSCFMSDVLKKAIRRNEWHLEVIDMPMMVANFQGEARRKEECLIMNYEIKEKGLFDM